MSTKSVKFKIIHDPNNHHHRLDIEDFGTHQYIYMIMTTEQFEELIKILIKEFYDEDPFETVDKLRLLITRANEHAEENGYDMRIDPDINVIVEVNNL
jgi:hypothetical protein